jgi:hypothetical protein
MHPREEKGYAMKSLTILPSASLAWRRSGATPPDFELLGTEGVYATLAFLDKEKTLARVRTAEGTWTFKHLGLLAPIVTLRAEGSPTNLATFHPHAFRHGKLEFQDGAVFDWAWLHAGGPGGAFLDPAGLPLVHLHAHSGRDLSSAPDLETCAVDLSMAPATHYRQVLLAALGWYLILFDHLKAREAVAAETALRL